MELIITTLPVTEQTPWSGFRIGGLMRYSVPIRLGEAWEYLEWIKIDFENAPVNFGVKTIYDDMYDANFV